MSWQADKARFNHDLLKNQFITAIGKLVRLLRGQVQEDDYLQHFAAVILPSWLKLRAQALNLSRRFEDEMSPVRLLSVEPLSRLGPEDREWMAGLLLECWTSSLKTRKLANSMEDAISAVDEQYDLLLGSLTSVVESGGQSPQAAGPLAECAEEFYRRCSHLSDLFSQLPSGCVPVPPARGEAPLSDRPR
jgi:hypothetical protein